MCAPGLDSCPGQKKLPQGLPECLLSKPHHQRRNLWKNLECASPGKQSHCSAWVPGPPPCSAPVCKRAPPGGAQPQCPGAGAGKVQGSGARDIGHGLGLPWVPGEEEGEGEDGDRRQDPELGENRRAWGWRGGGRCQGQSNCRTLKEHWG